MSSIRTQAEAVTARIDAEDVALDPITILTIITQVLPLVIGCFAKNDEPNSAKVKAKLARYNERNHPQLLRRTAVKVRQESKTKLSKSQSQEIAQAIIDQALEADESDVVSCCREAGE